MSHLGNQGQGVHHDWVCVCEGLTTLIITHTHTHTALQSINCELMFLFLEVHLQYQSQSICHLATMQS